MNKSLAVALLWLYTTACGGQTATDPPSPVGTYHVANASDVIAVAHAHGVEAINAVVKSLGAAVTKEDMKAGYDELQRQDAEFETRLTTARVTLLRDGTYAWTPSPVIVDKSATKVMAGRWTVTDQTLTFTIMRLDEVELPWSVQFVATWDGDLLRVGNVRGRLENTAIEGALLRRERR